MKLSVVIVNYNVRYFLELCLQSVQDALVDIHSEIIVVDNNSQDESRAMIKSSFPDVVLVENNENVGFSKANNDGVAIAKGEYVLILNPDTVVGNNTFKNILSFADAQLDFGTLGVKLIDGSGTFLPESKRGIPTPRVSFAKLVGSVSKTSLKYYANHLSKNETGKVSILVGAFMLMKRSVYNEVGGFDEDYFMYGEDIDLSYKILKEGYHNFYFADETVVHFKGESTIKDVKYLHYFNNAMKIFYEKHFKVNFFYDLVMKIGIRAWYLSKVFRMNQKEKRVSSVERILYVGADETFVKALQKEKNYQEVSMLSENSSEKELREFIELSKVQEVIFDNQNIDYQSIINLMEGLKGLVNFKFRPKKSNFILGSNSSETRGELIQLA